MERHACFPGSEEDKSKILRKRFNSTTLSFVGFLQSTQFKS